MLTLLITCCHRRHGEYPLMANPHRQGAKVTFRTREATAQNNDQDKVQIQDFGDFEHFAKRSLR